MKHIDTMRNNFPSALMRLGALCVSIVRRRTHEQDVLARHECRRWCDSSERQINYEIMGGRNGF